MKLIFLKNFCSKIKKIRIEDILQILLVATVALIVITIINPNFTGSYFGKEKPSLMAYFDIFVRYGVFIYIYFTLIPILILWVVKKALKGRWAVKTGFSFLVLSLFVLVVIYFVIPGPIHGDSIFGIPEYRSLLSSTVSPSETFKKIEETEHEFCKDRVDFFYNPTLSCSGELKDVSVALKNELEAKGSDVKVYIWCVGEDQALCEEYKSGEYTQEDVENLGNKYGLKALPATVVGCKYNLRGIFNIEEYKQIICEKFSECNL